MWQKRAINRMLLFPSVVLSGQWQDAVTTTVWVYMLSWKVRTFRVELCSFQFLWCCDVEDLCDVHTFFKLCFHSPSHKLELAMQPMPCEVLCQTPVLLLWLNSATTYDMGSTRLTDRKDDPPPQLYRPQNAPLLGLGRHDHVVCFWGFGGCPCPALQSWTFFQWPETRIWWNSKTEMTRGSYRRASQSQQYHYNIQKWSIQHSTWHLPLANIQVTGRLFCRNQIKVCIHKYNYLGLYPRVDINDQVLVVPLTGPRGIKHFTNLVYFSSSEPWIQYK